MKAAIAKIDRALKRLYNLDSSLRAEDFLLVRPPAVVRSAPTAALYIEPPSGEDDSLGMGIYLNPQTQEQLTSFPQWPSQWTWQQLASFSLAAEEVSHFHYVAHHAPKGRAVRQLELEFQGEIDKFLLSFFALLPSEPSAEATFQNLLTRLFDNFHWAPDQSEEERHRYEDAHRFAKSFLLKYAALLQSADTRDGLLKRLREFYRLSFEDKIRQANPR